MKRGVWILVFLLGLCSQPVWAARTSVHEAAESPQYGRKFGGMIGRGVLNAVTCFVDPIVNVVNETKAGPPLVGTLTGVAKGLGCGVLRLGSGAVDLVTFWVPGFNGFPVSDSYENCFAVSAPSTSTDTMPSGYGQSSSTWSEPMSESSPAQPPTQAAPEKPAKRKWTK